MKKVILVSAIVFAMLTVFGLQSTAQADEIYGCYKKNNGQLRIVSNLSKCLKSEKPIIISRDGDKTPPQFICKDDDVNKGIYRVCNYFPLNPNNQWKYTTGNYFISDNARTCVSGYSGILYATNTYEYSSYMQNGKDGFLFAGCQYDKGKGFEDMGTQIVFIPPQMKIGETADIIIPSTLLRDKSSTGDVTLIGEETINVPAGTFNTLKFELMLYDSKCTYKTTLWLAKGIGPVKIERTEPNPADCLGCIFVCDPDNNVDKLNTPAELESAIIKGTLLP